MVVETPFISHSNDIVRAFLSSVVLVDDQAYLKRPIDDMVPRKLATPGRQGGATTVVPSMKMKEPSPITIEGSTEVTRTETDIEPAPTATVAPAERSHTLDGKTVIDVFAKIGVVCGIMRPERDELDTLPDLLAGVGANSDAVILDWVLHDFKSGEKTLELIQRLVTSASMEHRTRLIVVYTAELDLAAIETEIRKALTLGASGAEPLTIVTGGTRICLYGKAGIRPAPIGDARSVAPCELAEIVVTEFTRMTKGLVSNVAMKSITAVRARTFQLLSRFGPDVDAPYVTQSALISPEKAEEQLTSLIASEIHEILEDDDVASTANYEGIVEWLEDQKGSGLAMPAGVDLSADEYYAGLLQLLRYGVRKKALKKLQTDHSVFFRKIVPGDRDNQGMYIRNALTGILRSHLPQPDEADELWTMLMSLRHRYTNPAPQLTLGALVARQTGNNTEYLLCLQPVCDSVRLTAARSFPLLLLKTASSSKNCDLIVRDGTLKPLTVKISPYLLEMVSFVPNREEKVMADGDHNAFWFSQNNELPPNSGSAVRFRWIADLKPAHAQRVANQFGTTFSRVGLIESEWNRLGSNW